MQQIIFFFLRNKNFLLFSFLFIIAIGLTINSHSYHSSKFVSSANFFSGGVYGLKTSITDYFNLKEQNEILSEENRRLRMLLSNTETFTSENVDTLTVDSNYTFTRAKVINNNYASTRNNLTLDKGERDSLKVDMGVISSKGVVGIVNSVSHKYASVQSVLNTNSQLVGRFKKSNHFGTIIWDTKSPYLVQLTEIPRIAPVAIGDTIITDGKSTIFPEGILIGTVKDFDRKETNDYYDINVALFSDMTSVKHVYVVKHRDASTIKQLESTVKDAE